jgi:anti-sigma regulatory factor (Ser/Thr protein kinase)
MSGSFPYYATGQSAGCTHRPALFGLGTPYRLVIDGAPEQVSAARAFVRQVLGSGHPEVDRAVLLTSELVTNSVEHSDSRLPGGTVSVTLQATADRVRVEVADDGGTSVPTLRSDDVQAEAGRGLRLVNACSLAWSYYSSAVGTVTWFECGPEPLP